jgi:hypothetical protein
VSGERAPAGPTTSEHGVSFWVAAAIGFVTMAFGVGGFLTDVGALGERLNFAAWIVGLDLVHDFLIAPIAALVGWALARRLPVRVRAPVRFGLFASAVLLFLAWSPLRGTADVTRNSSIQPLDYRSATLTVLAVTWLIAAAWLAVGAARQRARPRSTESIAVSARQAS